jgi:thymidylate kinase
MITTIVFEGMDCSGKSTLAEATLASLREQAWQQKQRERHFPEIVHFPKREIRDILENEQNPKRALFAEMLDHTRYERDHPKCQFEPGIISVNIYDRFWPSTLVYQYFQSRMGKAEIELAVKILNDIMPIDLVFYMRPDYEVWLDRVQRRGDEWMNPNKSPYDQWRRMTEAYDTVLLQSSLADSVLKIGTREDGSPRISPRLISDLANSAIEVKIEEANQGIKETSK